ncbi:YjjI family glycine radical enzyme [Shewanella fidelis]|uniref:YjjI family glycine radical enzyme n=1 Tax=Shewanella fidelis TaxID=173509 RepID=A0AAW8NSX6_9GAMM|nr:YjjI family glycine radical enzyme [Shewanella fidelis]MDR8525555.1 YjjI family glycine radical enzyme [Shewanella fidelis]MDW4813126.1 YjjI family glycine radical enzyme [Shewanella fidelis]MDW4816994.1 YjjI family glycine radical enzyme [Shewanella fidelis]MDW4820153.1 YjjI family glycine radical enzyme [Shewanella fidelis]MDW4825591.1 YjjI family glycine radical enzyme [Shewanella fidelis]
MTLQARFAEISRNPLLSPKQKSGLLALEAEASIPYVAISAAVKQAMAQGAICDMFEGHAPFKPRYVLPDYAKYLKNGSEYLELAPAQDLDEALNALTIIYHHVPSVTNIPVYLGQLDDVLLPYCQGLDDDTIYRKLKLFWIMLDRTLPDAFMHVNIGPTDNIVCRTILRIDAELKQIAPNLTFMYDPAVTPDELLQIAASNICECSKPHIANYPIHASTFDQQGFGIVSCYNSLPLAGGANTLVRLNLKEVALQASSIGDFFTNVLPHYCQLTFELIDARATFLHQESNFFNSFLVQEGLIEESRFAPMFGIYGMAEAVNILQGTPDFNEDSLDKPSNHYGHNAAANELGHQISKALDAIVKSTPVKYGYNGRALLHSQGGMNTDKDVTPGVRIPYGTEPNPITHIQALAEHHQYYTSGISDILTIDETVKANPQAMMQLCKGALQLGFREFSANVASNDLVRVTGYMVKLSDIARYKEQGSRTNTTSLGADAAQNTNILARQPRVVAHELTPAHSK